MGADFYRTGINGIPLMFETATILLLSFLADLAIGDPPYPLHPVRLMGRLVNRMEGIIRRLGWNGRTGGGAVVLITAAVVICVFFLVDALLFRFHPRLSLLFYAYLCYSCLALGDLVDHIRPLVEALKRGDLTAAREQTGKVVGREVKDLDEAGVSRAAIETLAENFVDGFLSPFFWYLAGGGIAFFWDLPPTKIAVALMLLFKVASTLDSMVGYRSPRYVDFGWAGARLDDLMNFIPARLGLLVLFLGAGLTGLQAREGLRVSLSGTAIDMTPPTPPTRKALWQGLWGSGSVALFNIPKA
jgi:adenosylcobinamide-phosphate synthase